MAFAYVDGRQNVQEFVEDALRRLTQALTHALLNSLRAGLSKNASRTCLGNSPDSSNCERRAEDFEVVVVHLVSQARVANLIHAFELVEADGVAVRHDEPVESDGEPCLAEGVHTLGFSQHLCSRRNEQVLTIMRVGVARDETFNRAGEFSV